MEKLNDGNRPANISFVSTFSEKHGAAISESLGPETLAGHLRGTLGERVKVDHIDLQIEDNPLLAVEKAVEKKPDIFGISVKIGATNQLDSIMGNGTVSNWMQTEEPIVVLGGVTPTFASIELLKRYPNTIIARGESEITVQELYRYLKGEVELEQVPGISFYRDGNIVTTTERRIDLAKLHFPARITTKKLHSDFNGMVWFEGSRGCDHFCTFCSRRSLRGSGFSGGISPTHVVDDLENLSKMGVTTMSASDDDWSGDPERSLLIADEIINRGLRVNFSVSTRADHIYNERLSDTENERLRYIAQRHKMAGLNRVFVGLESGSPTQLRRYGKNITVEGNYRALEILWNLGIDAVAGYIPIDPLMTLQELKENLEFLRKTKMYKKVTNPLSVMRVQEGSAYKTLISHKGLLGEATDDMIFYEVNGYQDPRVQTIADLSGQWVNEIYPIIYGLKGEVASDSLSVDNPNASNSIVEFLLHNFRELEIGYVEALVSELDKNDSRADIAPVKKAFYSKRDFLIGLTKKVIQENNLCSHNPKLLKLLFG